MILNKTHHWLPIRNHGGQKEVGHIVKMLKENVNYEVCI